MFWNELNKNANFPNSNIESFKMNEGYLLSAHKMHISRDKHSGQKSSTGQSSADHKHGFQQ